MSDYNLYTNVETWQMSLIIGNDQSVTNMLQLMARNWRKSDNPIFNLSQELEEYTGDMAYGENNENTENLFVSQAISNFLSSVDYHQIARNALSAYRENIIYNWQQRKDNRTEWLRHIEFCQKHPNCCIRIVRISDQGNMKRYLDLQLALQIELYSKRSFACCTRFMYTDHVSRQNGGFRKFCFNLSESQMQRIINQ